ncbi:MAG: nucleoside phosphorylase [Bacteroides sp.]|jgi:uridine phosphorylase|nr:nucleoside phosphorylase [Bacteroides sp.]
MKDFQESELIINPDGSLYHIKLKPEDVADTVILVGDQSRVAVISKHFDKIEVKKDNREFTTHTGWLNGKRITVISTGIGTDNIDIVVNELDAAVNFDLEKREVKKEHTSLDIIRLGTTGGLQPNLEVDTFVASAYGLGFDGLLNFYAYDEKILETEIIEAFRKHTGWNERLPYPYIVKSSDRLLQKLAYDLPAGITATANGFYGPQGRKLRIPLAFPELNERIESFQYGEYRITNFEMETSALFGLGKTLGHHVLTICDIIANRVTKQFSEDYKASVEKMVQLVLGRLTS